MRATIAGITLVAMTLLAPLSFAQEAGGSSAPTEQELRQRLAAADDAAKAAILVQLAGLLADEGRRLDAAYAWGRAFRIDGKAASALGEARVLLAFAEEVLAARESGVAIKAAFSDARLALLRAQKAGTADPEIGVGLARCADALGDVEGQIAVLRETIDKHPHSVATRRALGFALLNAERYEESVEQLGQLSLAEPGDMMLAIGLSAAARLGGLEDLAVEAAARAVEHHPDDSRGWMAVWKIYSGEKRFNELAGKLQELAARQPEAPLGAYYAGFACSSAERVDDAIRWLAKAVELQPTNAQARLEQARLLRDRKQDLDGAAAQYRAVLEVAPGHEQAVTGLRYLAIRLSDTYGRHADAVPLFRTIAESVGDDGTTWADLGLSLRWAGDYAEGKKAYEKAARLAPEDAQILNDFGLLLQAMELDSEAARVYRTAHAADPRHNDCVENLGFMARERGDHEASERWFMVAWQAARARGEDGARHRRNLDDSRFLLPAIR